MKSRLFFSILFVWVTFAGEEWTEVAYFQRQEAKMRINIYDPPIVMEWFQIPESVSEETREKLEAVAFAPTFMHDSFESWKKYVTQDIVEVMGVTKENFHEKLISLEEVKSKYLQMRFRNILYSIDYLLNDAAYSLIVFTISENSLSYFPENIKAVKNSMGITAKYLKFENGIWRGHYSSPKPFKAMEEFSDLDRLRAVMEAGYGYHSIEHMGIWPFAPSDVLKHDSVRDPYPGETLFRYPLKKPPIKKPAAPDPAAKTPSAVNPPAFSEEQDSAPLSGSCAVPWWTWLLAAYAAFASFFAFKRKKK